VQGRVKISLPKLWGNILAMRLCKRIDSLRHYEVNLV